jgi:hypothetical protein
MCGLGRGARNFGRMHKSNKKSEANFVYFDEKKFPKTY